MHICATLQSAFITKYLYTDLSINIFIYSLHFIFNISKFKCVIPFTTLKK